MSLQPNTTANQTTHKRRPAIETKRPASSALTHYANVPKRHQSMISVRVGASSVATHARIGSQIQLLAPDTSILTSSSSSSNLHSISNNNNTTGVDDATYISVLKSDILIVQKRIEDIVRDNSDLARVRSSNRIMNSQAVLNSESKGLQTKVSLLETLLEELMDLQQLMLRLAEKVYFTFNISSTTGLIEYYQACSISDSVDKDQPISSLSYIQPFVRLSDRFTAFLTQIPKLRNGKGVRQNSQKVLAPQETQPEVESKEVPHKASDLEDNELVHKLKDQLKKQEKEIKKLQSDLQASAQKLERTNSENTVLKKQQEDLKVAILDAEKLLASSKQEEAKIKSDSSKSAITLNNMKQQLESEMSKSEKMKKKYEEELDQMRVKYSEIEKKQMEQQKQRKQQTEESEELRTKVADLEKQLRSFEEKQESSNHSSDRLEKTLDENEKLKQANQTLKDQVNNLERHKVKLQQQIINIKDKNISFQKESKVLEDELDRLRPLQAKYNELKEEVAQLASIQKNDEESLQRMKTLQQYLVKAEDKYRVLMTESEQLKKKLESYKSIEVLYNECIEEVKKEREKRSELEEELRSKSSASVSSANYERTLKLLETKADKAEKLAVVREREIERCLKEIKAMNTRCQELHSELDEKDSQLLQLRARLEEMQEVLSQQNKSEFNIEAFIDILGKHENNILNQELEMMREAFERKLHDATMEIASIQAQYELQVSELQKSIDSERIFNERKISKLKERCNFLEDQLRKLESMYR